MTLKLADDCFVLDKDRLPHGEALAILKSRVRPVVEMEEVTLDNAAGRYLAEAIVAPRPIPAHDNAAVDGYSFAYASYDKARGNTLQGRRRGLGGASLHGSASARQRGAHLHRRGNAKRA